MAELEWVPSTGWVCKLHYLYTIRYVLTWQGWHDTLRLQVNVKLHSLAMLVHHARWHCKPSSNHGIINRFRTRHHSQNAYPEFLCMLHSYPFHPYTISPGEHGLIQHLQVLYTFPSLRCHGQPEQTSFMSHSWEVSTLCDLMYRNWISLLWEVKRLVVMWHDRSYIKKYASQCWRQHLGFATHEGKLHMSRPAVFII